MPKSLHHRLLEKGWSEEEIERTMHLMYSDQKMEKHAHFVSATHPVIYWIGLVVAIVGNLLVAVTLIPFLMILNSTQLYAILGIVGFVFGSMFNLIIKDIEHVDQTHHVVAGVFIPAIALITVYVMASVANRFNEVINNSNPHNAAVLSVVYLITFSAPYFVYKIRDFLWGMKQKASESS
ncbi:hypothetical protein JW898_04725 [Candidatus Woesearchaeota archaeon]|nr:hypothetical protein [Candidatus Woesearchaeota archaeon]